MSKGRGAELQLVRKSFSHKCEGKGKYWGWGMRSGDS